MSSLNIAEKRSRIEGRVAQILNVHELVINIGSAAGVRPGMKFAILADAPVTILDPENGRELDTVDREKLRVEASEVRSKITICRTLRAEPDYSAKMAAFAAFTESTRRPTLRDSDVFVSEPLSPENSYVKIKDRVIEVVE